MAAWEAKRQVAGAELEAAAKDKKPEDKKSLEACQTRLAELEKSKPMPPRIARIIYADATQEKLLRCLATGWPSAAIVSSEGGAVFGAHAMGRDSVMRTLGALNVLWDGGTLQVDRVSGGSFTVRGARLSINLQVQPAVLHNFMEGTKGLARGSGFLARFLLVAPETRQGTRMFQDPPPTWPALDAFNARTAELLATPATINDDGSLEPVVLDFSREAKAAWVEYHDRIEKELGPIGEFADVHDVAAKAADNIARMAALFHFLHGRNGYGNIGPEAVRSAALVVIWHLYEARRYLGALSSSPEEARAAALDSWLRDLCRREGVSTVSTRTAQQFGPVRDRRELDEALAALVERGRVKIIAEGKKRLIAINPALLEATP
jgi:putative DNA primase/helicase